MSKKHVNPALQSEPIGEPASIIAPRKDESLFRWIQSTGRFMANQSDKFQDDRESNELDDILDEDPEKDEEA